MKNCFEVSYVARKEDSYSLAGESRTVRFDDMNEAFTFADALRSCGDVFTGTILVVSLLVDYFN